MKTRNIILYLIGLLVFCSCEDMFDPADENNRQTEDMTEESKYAHGLLMYGYGRLPDIYSKTTETDVATDDAVTNLSNSAYLNMATGAWASDNNPMSKWDQCKDGIQYVNLFFSIVEKVKWAPSSKSKQHMFIDRMRGEAYGLRALFYYYLLQAHGGYGTDGVLYGVPLLTVAEDGSSDYNQPRATFADCMSQIFADCDSAMFLLPLDYKDISDKKDIPDKYVKDGSDCANYNAVFGNTSRGLMSGRIAETVKALAALLAASPAYREKSGVTSEQAANLCANVLKRIGGLEGFDQTGHIWYKNKSKLEPGAAEMDEILWRLSRGDEETDQESENFPPTLFGYGRVNPSQNLVDAFPMRSGRPITDAKSGYDAKNPYANRDPRLSDYIVYNGMVFKTGKPEIITGTYPNSKGESQDNINNQSGSSTRTGYYLKKLLRDDANPARSGSESKRYHLYPRIRYTEIYLAYAEAANDAWGPKSDGGNGFSAYDVIKLIRERAGLAKDEFGMDLPNGDEYLDECAQDKAKMTDLIRNERRIELCFENKRFWDMRRWLLPLDETVKGVKIERNEDTGELKYTIIDVEDRKYDNSYQCYGPIPKSEQLKWGNLMQNKGWK